MRVLWRYVPVVFLSCVCLIPNLYAACGYRYTGCNRVYKPIDHFSNNWYSRGQVNAFSVTVYDVSTVCRCCQCAVRWVPGYCDRCGNYIPGRWS